MEPSIPFVRAKFTQKLVVEPSTGNRSKSWAPMASMCRIATRKPNPYGLTRQRFAPFSELMAEVRMAKGPWFRFSRKTPALFLVGISTLCELSRVRMRMATCR